MPPAQARLCICSSFSCSDSLCCNAFLGNGLHCNCDLCSYACYAFLCIVDPRRSAAVWRSALVAISRANGRSGCQRTGRGLIGEEGTGDREQETGGGTRPQLLTPDFSAPEQALTGWVVALAARVFIS